MNAPPKLRQDITEFNRFLTLIREQQVRSYLEIGSKYGGSLWRIGSALPKGSRIVSVDLPYPPAASEQGLLACIDLLCKHGYDASVILGDSTDPKVVEAVRESAPFDLCFIDGDHNFSYVEKDWQNYGPMANIVAFHDIGFRQLPDQRKEPIEVPLVWARLKKSYQHVEIRNPASSPASNGIGVLWRTEV